MIRKVLREGEGRGGGKGGIGYLMMLWLCWVLLLLRWL